MPTARWFLPTVLLATAALAAYTAGAADQEGPSAGAPAAVQTQELECSPVATIWPATDGGSGRVQGPTLAVVRIDTRPKDVGVWLDGRFAGRARFFNGKQGYLYLEPGRYLLRLALEGYRSQAFEIAARSGCRFDLRHRMARGGSAPEELPGEPPGNGVPTQWVFAPADAAGSPSLEHRQRGAPDLTLRPDLNTATPGAAVAVELGSSLRLEVLPATAQVVLDGEFLATGAELGSMIGPLAVSGGPHTIEVSAQGFTSQRVQLETVVGEVTVLKIVLEAEDAR